MSFLIAVFLITISLFLNQLNNLIYRVINLASLSLITVGVWAYFTDLTFLYIVYILAFTGAVVMLFLSVILMLPASVTSKNSLTNGLIVTELTFIDNNLYYTSFLFLILFLMLIFAYTTIKSLKPNLNIFFVVVLEFFKSFWQFLLNITNIPNSINEIKQFILLIKNITGINAPTNVYGAFTKNSINMSALPILSYIGLYWQNTLYYIYINIESNLYNGISKTMYNLTKPVWNQLFMVLEYGYVPAKSYRQSKFPIPDIQKPYEPAELEYSLFKLMPYTISITLFKYLHGNFWTILWINRIIFFINLINFFIINIIFNIFAYLYVNDILDGELFKQIIFIVSIFSLMVPINFSNCLNTWNNVVNLTNLQSIDSLLAIKEILYENNILFLMISVIGLLVALIGSAVFTRNNK